MLLVGVGRAVSSDVVMPDVGAGTVLFAGDWHGDHRAAWDACRAAEVAGCAVVVQLGDFGVWSGRNGAHYLDEVSKAAVRHGVTVCFIDGNHENFDLLLAVDTDPATGLRELRERVMHIPRGSRWTWCGVRFAALGGATSLDRPGRVESVSWWPQEALTYSQARTFAEDGPVDVLLTHDCPQGVSIPGIDPLTSLRMWPETELRVAWAHRELLAQVCEQVSPLRLLHGHFHVRYDAQVTLWSRPTLVSGLADQDGGDGNRLVVNVAQISGHTL